MRKQILLAFLLFAAFASKGQVLLNEGFEGTFAPPGWTNTAINSPTGGNIGIYGYTWLQNQSTPTVIPFYGTGPNPSAHTGTKFAFYDSYNINYGGLAELVTPALDFSTSANVKVLSFWVHRYSGDPFPYYDSLRVFVNTSATSAGGTLLAAITPNISTTTGWTQYNINIPGMYSGATNYIIFRAYSGYGYDIYLDDIIVATQTPPAPVVTTNSPICPGTSLVITATAPAGYPSPTFTLIGPGISSTTSTTGIFTIPNAQAANAGNFNVTVTSGGFTSAATTTAVQVLTVPTVTISNIISPTNCLINNASFQINGLPNSTAYTLSYRKNGTNITPVSITSTAGGSYVVTGLGAGTYDSIRVKTSQSCYSIPVTAVIIAPNPPPPPVAVAQPAPLCPGSTLLLSVSNVATKSSYSWTGPGSYTAATASAIRANVQPNATYSGTYTVTVLDSLSGCTSQGTVAVTVSSPSPAPVPNSKQYCQYDVADTLTAQGVGLKWYDTTLNPLGTLLPKSPTPSTNIPKTIMWYVTQTLPGGCESIRNASPIFVRINPKPLAPTVPNTTIELCQYQVAGPLSAAGNAIRWYTTPTGGTGSATAPTPVTLVPGTYYFYASQTSPLVLGVGGCESDRLTITVIVKPKPQPPGVTSPLNLCQGDPVAPLVAIGQDLLWYTVPTGGIGVSIAPLPNTGHEDSAQYYVTQTVKGCESDRALLAVYIHYKPNGIITGTSPWVCQDEVDTFYYYGNARPDADYNWYAPLSASFISGAGTAGPVVIHFDTAGTSIVRLTINNKGCISTLISAPITVRPLPKVTFVNRQDICQNDLLTVSLSSISENISGYSWDFGSDDAQVEYGVRTTGGPFGVRYPESGQYHISVTATSAGCTSKPVYQEVYVHELPDATISSSPSPVDICASDTLFLSVRSVSEGGVYIWSPSAYFQGERDTLNNEVFAVVSQSSEVKVRVRTAFGCEATDSLLVSTKPCCKVYFANAFAPGGKNRIFRPITNGIHRINTFRIVNRWGQVVYETKVERAGWNGMLNGEPQDMGTYYYYISYKCEGKDVEESGEFLLLR